MSQKLVATPSSRDISSILANTSARSPELANRKEIPLTGFDLLNGSYVATRRARKVVFALAALSMAFAAWVVVGTLRTDVSTDEVDARLTELVDTRDSLLTEFGSVEGYEAQALLDRDLSVVSSLVRVTAEQPDFTSLFNQLSALPTSYAIVSVSVGEAPKDTKNADDAETTTPTGVAVRINIESPSTAETIQAVKDVRGVSTLVAAEGVINGRTAYVTGFLRPEQPPAKLLNRLTDFGIPSGLSTYKQPAAPADGASETTTEETDGQ
jgi:hypothetical protein